MANVFRPAVDHPFPVVMSVTPYGKDVLPDWIHMTLMRLTGVRFGHLACSNWTGFEAPDPLFWTRAGFVVMQADVRGMHKSEGHAGVLTDQDAQDYYDLIEWAARQPWSSGAVGLVGVSYLCMSQWRVAALRPPSLKAFIPWEGVTDLLREFAYQDGVRATSFMATWWRFRMTRGRNRQFAMAENFPAERDRHQLDDDWWESKRPRLEAIDVPALVCASWSDHGLHTRGSFEGFERIGSRDKWLFTHGRRKWETFYSPEARDLQRRFFDRFLKGEDNGWERAPRVRLEVRQARDEYVVRFEPSWPLPAVAYTALYLDAKTGQLAGQPLPDAATVRYQSTGRRGGDHLAHIRGRHRQERRAPCTVETLSHAPSGTGPSWLSFIGRTADRSRPYRTCPCHTHSWSGWSARCGENFSTRCCSGTPVILSGNLPTSRPTTTRHAATRCWRATRR